MNGNCKNIYVRRILIRQRNSPFYLIELSWKTFSVKNWEDKKRKKLLKLLNYGIYLWWDVGPFWVTFWKNAFVTKTSFLTKATFCRKTTYFLVDFDKRNFDGQLWRKALLKKETFEKINFWRTTHMMWVPNLLSQIFPKSSFDFFIANFSHKIVCMRVLLKFFHQKGVFRQKKCFPQCSVFRQNWCFFHNPNLESRENFAAHLLELGDIVHLKYLRTSMNLTIMS